VIRPTAPSPYITTHLTRFDRYSLDRYSLDRYSLDRARGAATLDDDLPILSTQPRAKGQES